MVVCLMKRFEEFFVRDGRFVADGVPLERMAGHSTPFYIYSASAIRAKYRLLSETFPEFDVCYSAKANPNAHVLRLLREAGAGAEVSSSAELAAAVSAGFKPEKIVYVAPAKTAADMEKVLAAGVLAIVADAGSDIELVEAAARKLGTEARVLLRINTRESQPEAKEVMVGGPSKFGFDEESVIGDVSGLKLKRVRVAGLQVYSASQVLNAAWLAEHIAYVLRLAKHLSREIGFKLETVDFGGGFGVPQHERDQELDLPDLSAAVAAPLARFRAENPGSRLLFESGRYLVAEAGVFVTRVVRVKESRGRVFAICDGGMNVFSRPVFMRVRHPVRLLNRLSEAATAHVDVCGPICTPLDCLDRDAHLPMPRPGDLVGFLNAGAYGYSMSLLSFMSLRRATELVADAGELRKA
jgi:diaminopimelate decarboxylase